MLTYSIRRYPELESTGEEIDVAHFAVRSPRRKIPLTRTQQLELELSTSATQPYELRKIKSESSHSPPPKYSLRVKSH
jgi:hypothetical protein